MKTNTLYDWQKDAIISFKKFGYLIVDAPRQSGKTTLLKKIISMNPHETIGVACSSVRNFDRHYRNIKKCMFINSDDLNFVSRMFDFTLLIGDEVILEPIPNMKTACAYTNKNIIFRVNLDNIIYPVKFLDNAKHEMSSIAYTTEFGQYKSNVDITICRENIEKTEKKYSIRVGKPRNIFDKVDIGSVIYFRVYMDSYDTFIVINKTDEYADLSVRGIGIFRLNKEFIDMHGYLTVDDIRTR